MLIKKLQSLSKGRLPFLERIRMLRSELRGKADSSQVELCKSDKMHQNPLAEIPSEHIQRPTYRVNCTSAIVA